MSDFDNKHSEEIDDVQSEDSEADGAKFSNEIQETKDEDSATEEEHDKAFSTVAEESNSSTASSNTTSMNLQTFTGKNGRLWSSTCPPSSHTHACNIRHTAEGPLADAKNIETDEKIIMLFINENMLRQVAKYTNVYAQKYLEANRKNSNDWTPVDLCQIKVIVRLLFLIGVYQSQHESLHCCGYLAFLRDLYFWQLLDATDLNRSWPICDLTFEKNQSQTDKFAPFCQF